MKDAALGITALGSATASACADVAPAAPATDQARLAPEKANLIRLSMARTDLPVAVWDDTLALAKLGHDVVTNPTTAARFREDPASYLRSLGLDHVKLETDAVEVRLALAMGDRELRSHIDAGEYGKFIDALNARGLLEPVARSPLATRIAAELSGALGPTDGTEVVAVFAAAVVLVLVAVTYITVGYSVVAGVMVGVGAGFTTYLAVTHLESTGRALLRHAPGLGLARAMGGNDAGRLATEAFVESTVDSTARILESSDVYKSKSKIKLSGDELRQLIRDTLHLQLAVPPPA